MEKACSSRQELIARFALIVRERANNPAFIHNVWYVKYHLEIVEQLALELIEKYPEASRDLVQVLVWLHDYPKIIDPARKHELVLEDRGRQELEEIGFDRKFVDLVVRYARLHDDNLHQDLSQAPLEVQIVSTADGCSHFVGPFFQLWWWENAERSFVELMADNRRKIVKDWNRKIVLPEARAAFEPRYRFLLEQTGTLPARFIS
jgi:hypothetical protein